LARPGALISRFLVVAAFAYRGSGLMTLECDGRVGHGHEAAFERDRVRSNDLELAGWLVLHYTWRRLTENPEAVVAEVRQALEARAYRLDGSSPSLGEATP
jgi:very-short-patch-repair endonuclease